MIETLQKQNSLHTLRFIIYCYSNILYSHFIHVYNDAKWNTPNNIFGKVENKCGNAIKTDLDNI